MSEILDICVSLFYYEWSAPNAQSTQHGIGFLRQKRKEGNRMGAAPEQQSRPILPPVSLLKYETSNWVWKKIHDKAFEWVISRIPARLAHWLFLLGSPRQNGETKTVFSGRANHEALEVLYTFPDWPSHEKSFSGRLWWFLLYNARSVRNRLILVKEEVQQAAGNLHGNGLEVRLLSMGAGSARPVLLALKELEFKCALMLLDQRKEALSFSEDLRKKLGINHTTRIEGDFRILRHEWASWAPNIVEVVGVLDYLEERQAYWLLKTVREKILVPGGTLVTGNIIPNMEAPFVAKAIHWKMVYRTPQQLESLLLRAGFARASITIRQEPLGIHSVAIAKA